MYPDQTALVANALGWFCRDTAQIFFSFLEWANMSVVAFKIKVFR
jgi:hypothetical protein